MKNAIIGIIGGFILIYVTVISLSIYSKNVRENELNCTISEVMKQTLKQDNGLDCKLHQREQKADIEVKEELIQEITKRLSSDSEVQVDVKACDMEKGIISVAVKEMFTYPNGKVGEVGLAKTIIVDRKIPVMADKTEGDQEYETVMEENQILQKDGMEIEDRTEKEANKENETNVANESKSVWEQPQEFHEKFKNEIVFHAINRNNGTIYCATKENALPHRYRLLGWKVELQDEEIQRNVQTLFFQLGGKYMKLLKTSQDLDNSNEYILYGLSTVNLKAKLNKQAQELLKEGKLQIVFQGCIAPVEGESVAGTLEEDGQITGKVCTSREEIQNWDFWTASEKEQLDEYFDKKVANLFHTVTLLVGEGIESVTGEGTYIHGATVEIDAVLQPGYEFNYWWGKETKRQKKLSIQVESDMEWTAHAVRSQMLMIPMSDIKMENSKEPRFISKKYFEKDNQDLILEEYGGLSKESCWIVYPEYRELLRKILNMDTSIS